MLVEVDAAPSEVDDGVHSVLVHSASVLRDGFAETMHLHMLHLQQMIIQRHHGLVGNYIVFKHGLVQG